MPHGAGFRHYSNFSKQMADHGVRSPVSECTPEEARAIASRIAGLAGPAPEMRRVEERTIDGVDGSLILRVLTPFEYVRGVLVYYHGGGWVTGSVDEYETVARKLAERTSCAVVLVDYRLAPEHRYPAAVNDAYAALEWVGKHISDIAGEDVPLIMWRGTAQAAIWPR